MMNGDKGRKGGYELHSNFERESKTEAEASETPKQDGGCNLDRNFGFNPYGSE